MSRLLYQLSYATIFYRLGIYQRAKILSTKIRNKKSPTRYSCEYEGQRGTLHEIKSLCLIQEISVPDHVFQILTLVRGLGNAAGALLQRFNGPAQ